MITSSSARKEMLHRCPSGPINQNHSPIKEIKRAIRHKRRFGKGNNATHSWTKGQKEGRELWTLPVKISCPKARKSIRRSDLMAPWFVHKTIAFSEGTENVFHMHKHSERQTDRQTASQPASQPNSQCITDNSHYKSTCTRQHPVASLQPQKCDDNNDDYDDDNHGQDHTQAHSHTKDRPQFSCASIDRSVLCLCNGIMQWNSYSWYFIQRCRTLESKLPTLNNCYILDEWIRVQRNP